MAKIPRMTRQKKLITEILRNTVSHPTADWIYEQARKQIPDLSLGTVYRTLNQLKESGQILELNYGRTYSRYDGNPVNHYHFQCRECGRVFDLDWPGHIPLPDMTGVVDGHRIQTHRLEFYGTCRECAEVSTDGK